MIGGCLDARGEPLLTYLPIQRENELSDYKKAQRNQIKKRPTMWNSITEMNVKSFKTFIQYGLR